MNFIKAKDTYRKNAVVQGKMAKRLIEETLKICGGKFGKVLEIGSGTGILTDEIYKRFEFGGLFLNDLTENYTEHTPKKFYRGDFLKVKIEEKFDLIMSNAVFQWIEDYNSLFLKINSLLNEGGRLCFTSFGKKNFIQIKETTGFSLNYEDFEERLKKTGFKVLYKEEELQTLYFEDVRKILEHIRATGTGSNSACLWTKSKYEQFVKKYREYYEDNNGTELTYHPVYYIAEKTT